VNLDFSQFHPIDHNVLECRGYPGGRRRHLRYRWIFHVQPWLRVRWLHATGRHAWVAVGRPRTNPPKLPPWKEDMDFFVVCEGCDARPDPATAERIIASQLGAR
jgi:hypothetical protein